MVLVVASGYGIGAVILYMKKIILGYNTPTTYARRLHFVWQVETLGKGLEAMAKEFNNPFRYCSEEGQDLLNDLLQDDILDNGYGRLHSFNFNLCDEGQARPGSDITTLREVSMLPPDHLNVNRKQRKQALCDGPMILLTLTSKGFRHKLNY
ncbi:hypothetical protein TSTA_115850 [Talaromyces stipitatus ATCC 10500]|uniref:Ferric reductase NAD binding domain-containing protein n=1 Tax=Talaromyces stipitatus (strain ATCC 10500 / CBS 375.48 / QM 6759 / NRRL 1006) TaxID=441959 RepID=B8MAV2_TALSN|nr:uncharacterized protein TSTA_115850 [Talaromyces stipitatus ATCC 10500]EED17792.1 hypothetical protein TSTA_115850 [Talaromyces stipitatus ATCC 10500]